MEPPKNLSNRSLVQWIIGILTAVVVFLFGAWDKGQSDLLEKETQRANDNKKDADKWQDKYMECQQQKSMYEVIHRFGVAPGRKTVEVTPDQQNTDDYEN